MLTENTSAVKLMVKVVRSLYILNVSWVLFHLFFHVVKLQSDHPKCILMQTAKGVKEVHVVPLCNLASLKLV